jgi:hypothetical protein
MKRLFVALASILGLALLAPNLHADMLVGPGGAFQNWTAAVLGPASNPTYGGPYWNNPSGDGKTGNIGWCLVGDAGCVIASPPGAIASYLNGDSAVPNMYFQSSGVPVTVSLLGMYTNQIGSAKNPGYNVFGWYEVNPNGTIGAVTTLWNSKTGTVGESATFSPTGDYGLADYFWFMNQTQDYSAGPDKNPVDSYQHFAVFSGVPGQYFIGMDDTNNGDRDFNNMIIKVSNAPEPPLLVLAGLGLILCSFCLKRMRA